MLWVRKLVMRMFDRPRGVLGRLGGASWRGVNRDAAAQIIDHRKDPLSFRLRKCESAKIVRSHGERPMLDTEASIAAGGKGGAGTPCPEPGWRNNVGFVREVTPKLGLTRPKACGHAGSGATELSRV
jgi:hypothetical protein